MSLQNRVDSVMGEGSAAYVGTFVMVSSIALVLMAVAYQLVGGVEGGKDSVLPAMVLIYELAFIVSGVAFVSAAFLFSSRRRFRTEVPAFFVYFGALFFIFGFGGMYSSYLATRRLFMVALVSVIAVCAFVLSWLLYSDRAMVLTENDDVQRHTTERIAHQAAHQAVDELDDLRERVWSDDGKWKSDDAAGRASEDDEQPEGGPGTAEWVGASDWVGADVARNNETVAEYPGSEAEVAVDVDRGRNFGDGGGDPNPPEERRR